MKKKTQYIGGMIGLVPTLAFAQGGGVHGGGHIFDVNGTPELIELVKGTTCEWKSGDEVLVEAPQTLSTLKKLAQLDWYFANAIEREIRKLNFCFTGKLFRVTPVDPQSPVATTVQIGNRYTQAALRLDSTVYVDSDEFAALSPNRRSTLLIHEAMHSFIPMALENSIRYLYLWTIVKDISLIPNRINTREALHQEMTLNQVTFPLSVDSLDRDRTQIEFLFGSSAFKQQMVRNGSTDRLIQNAEFFTSKLSREDQAALLAVPPKQRLINAIAAVFTSGTDREFQTIIARNETLVKPVEVAIQMVNQLSESKRDLLFKSSNFRQLVSNNLQVLNQMGVRQGPTRIQASVELARLLGAQVSEETPLTGLSVKVTPSFEMKVVAQLLIVTIQQGQWAEVQALFSQNPEFHSALGLANQIAQVSVMNPTIVREKALALEFLAEAKKNLLQSFLTLVSNQVSPAQFEKFKSLLR